MLRTGIPNNESGNAIESESYVAIRDDDDDHGDDDTHSNTDDDHGDDDHGDDDHGGDDHGDDGHGGHGDGHAHDPLGKDHLLAHVKDAPYIEYSGWLTGGSGVKHLDFYQPLETSEPIIGSEDSMIKPLDLKFTKFMFIEVVVAVLLIAIFVPIAKRISQGGAPKGRLLNLFEVLLVYVRNDVARTLIGKHDGDKYVPYLWTIFFFALFCNLLGLVPMMGSPTGALATTAVLSLATFGIVIGTGVQKMGFIGFVKAQLPHMELSPAIGIFIKPMVFVIEIVGLFMKHFVLALRLFANMFAGHLILAVLLGFIALAWGSGWVYMVVPVSLAGCVAINFLELLVAFLQAYIFTFLSALFIGAAAHPH